MNNVECPYCGEGQEISHDNGYGCEEGETYQQTCSCGKTFVFDTSISIDHTAYIAPCLNGAPHDNETNYRNPRVINGMIEFRCKWCDERKNKPSDCSAVCEKDKMHECYQCDISK